MLNLSSFSFLRKLNYGKFQVYTKVDRQVYEPPCTQIQQLPTHLLLHFYPYPISTPAPMLCETNPRHIILSLCIPVYSSKKKELFILYNYSSIITQWFLNHQISNQCFHFCLNKCHNHLLIWNRIQIRSPKIAILTFNFLSIYWFSFFFFIRAMHSLKKKLIFIIPIDLSLLCSTWPNHRLNGFACNWS